MSLVPVLPFFFHPLLLFLFSPFLWSPPWVRFSIDVLFHNFCFFSDYYLSHNGFHWKLIPTVFSLQHWTPSLSSFQQDIVSARSGVLRDWNGIFKRNYTSRRRPKRCVNLIRKSQVRLCLAHIGFAKLSSSSSLRWAGLATFSLASATNTPWKVFSCLN